MQLQYNSPEAREAFLEWYNKGEHKDITGKDMLPENHPDIEAIVRFYNNEIVFGPAVEVINGQIKDR